jgi:undecaprenyl diphosphate synthase
VKNNLPIHIAIIPDGNRRWAKEKGLKPWEGHEAGAKNTENLVRKAFELRIKNMSFWGSSLENITKRSLRERQELLRIYGEYLKKLIDSEDIQKNKARINVIGKWEENFPESLKKVVSEAQEKTRNNDRYNLNFMLAYSGDDEMVETVKKIVAKYDDPQQITAQIIKDNLMTRKLPPVDLLIRTGGEPHLSAGFMMWDIANSQLYFSEKYYPDFDGTELEKAVEEYQRRERRMGK